MKNKVRNKVYCLYYNFYFEGYYLGEFKEIHDGYELKYKKFRAKCGDVMVPNHNNSYGHLSVHDNKLDCICTIGVDFINHSTSIIDKKYRRLPFDIKKILRITKKYKPEEFI